jgi:hypothetical protein
MSTEYRLVCHECKTWRRFCSYIGASGWYFYAIDNTFELENAMRSHYACAYNHGLTIIEDGKVPESYTDDWGMCIPNDFTQKDASDVVLHLKNDIRKLEKQVRILEIELSHKNK